MSELYIQKIIEDAIVPTRGTSFSAGYDLSSVENYSILPNSTILVSTGLKLKIPTGHYGRIAPRSGISVKKQLFVNAGVIDEDYRGEVKIVFYNPTQYIVSINKGERVAQLIIEKISYPIILEVDDLDKTDNLPSERGERGFGSTGNL
jgi:dUTP pyrophosphatase